MRRHYDNPEGDPNLGEESAKDLEILSNHISRWWGTVSPVYHEIRSDYVHLDLHIVPACVDRPYHAVITTGMSDRPMKPSAGGPERYCELLLALPPEWPIQKEKFNEERFWWPFRHLKQTAKFPHAFKTFVWYGHTISNENPPQPFHETAQFCGGVLSIPALCPEEALSIHVRQGKEVFFFSFLPLYEPELKFAEENGSEALIERLEGIGVTELIHVGRGCVA
jgi:hypothetical protein